MVGGGGDDGGGSGGCRGGGGEWCRLQLAGGSGGGAQVIIESRSSSIFTISFVALQNSSSRYSQGEAGAPGCAGDRAWCDRAAQLAEAAAAAGRLGVVASLPQVPSAPLRVPACVRVLVTLRRRVPRCAVSRFLYFTLCRVVLGCRCCLLFLCSVRRVDVAPPSRLPDSYSS